MKYRVLFISSVGLLLFVAGCTATSRYVTPSTPLDRAIRYKEQMRSGAVFNLSGEKPDSTAITRKPLGTEVDVNSTILVEIEMASLLKELADTSAISKGSIEEFQSKKDQLVKGLDVFGELLVASEKALVAYQATVGNPSPQLLKSFRTAVKDLARLKEQVFVNTLYKIWKEDTPDGDRLDDILTANTRDFTGLQEFLQDKIDELDQQIKQIAKAVEASRVALRLEAFLEPGGGTPHAIHLEGYDSLAAGVVRYQDQLGLVLTDAQRGRLGAASAASIELANAANQVKNKERSLQVAVSSLMSPLGFELGQRVVQLDQIIQRLDANELKSRFDKGKAAFTTFFNDVENKITDVDINRKIAVSSNGILKGLDASSIQAAIVFVNGSKGLITRWQTKRQGDLPQLIAESLTLQREAETAIDGLKKLVENTPQTFASVKRLLTVDLSSLGVQVKNEIKTIWDHSDAKAFTTSLASEVNPLISQLDILAGLFGAGGAVQPELNTRVPEAFHVPLDEIANTQIELPRTSRVVGDRITLRGTVLGADDENNEKKPLASSVSSFEVERFGYRADLVPGVVLVKPDQHAEVKNFLFAPTLSWLHKYSPRPDQNGALSRINRLLQPAVGIHAIFLPFDIQETLAVGLGATVSVWGDILVGGVGYNLMARHKDEGQIYYFMGTSLIPLLQTLGFGKNQGAGIK